MSDRFELDVEDVYPSSPLGEQEAGIPTGRDVEWEPLVDYRRNGVSENTIHGAIAWWSGNKMVHSFGGNVLCYGRSMMKPFYIKVFAEELSDCDWKQKAISVASHNGSAEHVEVAQSLLSEGEWGLMQTPLDLPLVQFGRQVRRPRRWFNNSSGHHAAIFKGCRLKGLVARRLYAAVASGFQRIHVSHAAVFGRSFSPNASLATAMVCRPCR